MTDPLLVRGTPLAVSRRKLSTLTVHNAVYNFTSISKYPISTDTNFKESSKFGFSPATCV